MYGAFGRNAGGCSRPVRRRFWSALPNRQGAGEAALVGPALLEARSWPAKPPTSACAMHTKSRFASDASAPWSSIQGDKVRRGRKHWAGWSGEHGRDSSEADLLGACPGGCQQASGSRRVVQQVERHARTPEGGGCGGRHFRGQHLEGAGEIEVEVAGGIARLCCHNPSASSSQAPQWKLVTCDAPSFAHRIPSTFVPSIGTSMP